MAIGFFAIKGVKSGVCEGVSRASGGLLRNFDNHVTCRRRFSRGVDATISERKDGHNGGCRPIIHPTVSCHEKS